jgi:IMP dehydrogenase
MISTYTSGPAFTVDDITLIPVPSNVNSRQDVRTHNFLWSAPMDTVTGSSMTAVLIKYGHNPVVSRFIPREEIIKTVKLANEIGTASEPVFFATGLDGKFSLPLHKVTNIDLEKFGIAIDVANGTTTQALKAIEKWKRFGFKNIMSGSICTAEQARSCVNAGATHLRVGVGPGAGCTTRLMTGVGVPNAYAVFQIRSFLDSASASDIILIADGGIRYPGDVVKYLALGADGAMLGSVFSKAREAAGWMPRDGKLYKSYRGQASAEFQQDQYSKINSCPEGVSHPETMWDGTTVRSIVEKFEGGLRSACTYLNIKDSRKIYKNTKWIKITANGAIEAQPHGLTTRL